jgi:hypothetical protein
MLDSRPALLFLAACAYWSSAAFCSSAAEEPSPRLVLGGVANGSAIAICREDPEEGPFSKRLVMRSTPLAAGGPGSGNSREFSVEFPTAQAFQWRIGHNCLWAGGDAISLRPADILRLGKSEFVFFDLANANRAKELAIRYPKSATLGSLPTHRWLPAPAYGAYYKYRGKEWGLGPFGENSGGTGPHPPIPHSHYDFLPIAEEAVLLFVMYRGEICVWRGDGKWEQASERWTMKWSEKPLEEFETEITEPFWVGGSEKQFLFVTQSGRLYAAAKGEDGKHKLEPAWRMGSQPIVAVITDVDANRYFAFTKPLRDVKLDGKPMYFELGPDPKPEPYDRDAILKDAKDDPAAVTALARFLVEQGKIKVKQK